MVADLAMRDVGPSAAEAEFATPTPDHWDVLDRLEKTSVGTRGSDGAVSVRRQEPAGCLLYGPYLHLPQGHYRLTFRCRCGAPQMAAQPVLGIEIIVLARFQQLWRDFTALELADGSGSLDFEVAAEHSLESENEGRFEYRFFHLGNADIAHACSGYSPPSQPRAQLKRLLGGSAHLVEQALAELERHELFQSGQGDP